MITYDDFVVLLLSADDVRSEFKKFGPIADVWIARQPPGFAFVEVNNHFSNNNFLYVSIRVLGFLEVWIMLRGKLGFYGRSKVLEMWFWRRVVWYKGK